MDSSSLPPDAVTLLTALGLGKDIAAISSLAALIGFVIVHVVPHIPPPADAAPGWWKIAYQALAWIAGNYHYASNVKTTLDAPKTTES